MKSETFKLRLDKDMMNHLRAEAKRRRCSVAQVLRDMVVTHMESGTCKKTKSQ